MACSIRRLKEVLDEMHDCLKNNIAKVAEGNEI